MKTNHFVAIVLMLLAGALLLAAAPVEEPRAGATAAPSSGLERNLQGTPSGVDARATGGPPAPSSSQGPAEDIRDIRGPRDIPDPWSWARYGAWAALALVILYAAWRMFGRRKERAKSAHERAFEALERARGLMQPENARAFSFEVSAVVRRYIEERFEVRSTQQTTAEFLRWVSERPAGPLAAQRTLLAEFLRNCDLVKFARFGLTQAEMAAMFDSAWQFVDATKAVPEEPRRAGFRSPVARMRRWVGRPEAGHRAREAGSKLMVGGVS